MFKRKPKVVKVQLPDGEIVDMQLLASTVWMHNLKASYFNWKIQKEQKT